jgi:hypothetical protein
MGVSVLVAGAVLWGTSRAVSSPQGAAQANHTWEQWLATDDGRRAAETVVRLPQTTWQAPTGGIAQRAFVRRLAEGAWHCLTDIADRKTALPLDRLDLAPIPELRRRTSTTNTGLDLACTVGARKLGFIDQAEMRTRLVAALSVIERLKSWHGLPFEWFSTETLEPEQPHRASMVASGWLCAGLMVATDALEGADKERCKRLVSQFDLASLYDRATGTFFGHFDEGVGFSPYHSECLASETRIASYVAIALGQVPQEHLFRLWRTMPDKRDPQTGHQRSCLSVDVWEQPLEYRGVKLGAASWGGAMFEALAPPLMVDESKFAPHSLGRNDRATVEAHIAQAHEVGASVWGLSPCSVPGRGPGGYHEFGVPQIGTVGSYGVGVVTPHASALALQLVPGEATRNLRGLITRYPEICGPYGPYDAVDANTGQVCRAYLALDQEMLLLAIVNYLRGGCIQKAFHRYSGVAERLEPILGIEAFDFGD